MHNPLGSWEGGGKSSFLISFHVFGSMYAQMLLLLGRVMGHPGRVLLQRGLLVDVVVGSILTVLKQGYGLGLGIYGISGETQH